MTPRTSVLMPAYRNEETLRASVESALAQTVGDLELIVVDDASPIPCADVLAEVRDPRRGARHDYIGDPAPHPLDTVPKFAEACPVPALTATMRRDAVLTAGGYAQWVWGASDYHLYAKLVAGGWRFAYVHRRLARYRWPVAGKSKSADERRADRGLLMMWLGFVARHPRVPGPRRQVRVRLRRELRPLAAEVRRRARAPRAPLRPR
jgi:hypothetical protein